MLGKEPAVILGALSEVVRQAIPMLIIFGIINWSGEQTAAVNIFVGVVVGFFNVLLTRSQTVSTETANSQIATAIRMPSSSSVGEVIAKQKDESQ